ncbi:MAG TPA: Ni/Fe-hydrogenase, b-type cytochrome subunit [Candidatus Thioglobus sp.]|jgi:Ni/Fe-hydrogenase 1 B-type cytochrome subunit|nr:Ni/Fe-hydrogenase, b-type cytochrome subunit [Candidatus Thioglobus sp.]HIB97446.1 Ni/Fe-hydrogenase, b-type cytochrome subunit [Candidatus Thioglobus sp.]
MSIEKMESAIGDLPSSGIESTVEATYVYEAPLRLWHWVNAAAILVLAVTGYLIGSPLPSLSGEASDHYLMGYIRFFHFVAAYVFAVGLIGRIYWAFVGNSHAKQLFLPPLLSKTWWAEIWHEMKWYAFLVKTPKKYVGHNPLASLAMFTMFVTGSIFMIFTGFALYAEGQGMDSWWYDAFAGWLIPLFGQSQDVHTWHHIGMWFLITFIMIHIYAAIREDIMSRQSLVSTMINGWRTWKDDRKD